MSSRSLMMILPSLAALMRSRRLPWQGAEAAGEAGASEPQALVDQAARIDPLTGLGNRLALEEAVATGESVGALLLLNLDRFRFVNATMGNRAGDELLVQLSDRLQTCFSAAGDVFRLGDDDFAMLVRGRPSKGKIEDLCDTVRALFAKPFPLTLGEFWINASIGVAPAEPRERDLAALVSRALTALHKAKAVPGTVHVLYSPTLMTEADALSELQSRLASALENGELYLEYQPILSLKTGVIATFEALLRWNLPEEGEVAPERFIHLAESTGLIVPIGRWVLQTACREAMDWPDSVGVAVNIAGDQLRDPNFLGHVEACLRETGLAPHRLTVELTESIFSVDPDVVSASLGVLRQLGVQVALDDFGRGFSSIHYLRSFSLDNLQIDRSFTKEMGEAGHDGRTAELLQRLESTLDLATTIEGVETDAQFEQARALGASAVQGFLISRPMAARDVPLMLAGRGREKRRRKA
ncbi:putative bifunctional diguanylate cyclase/phosphodiesterase [Rhizobium sp. YIM 134829]|uniref:putative bifunctional diguanylate cyclase/phosphodiesterase n=1 Tax=Rhizobium sp. YIM 134829 TaxID=3390453 RepID=UPI00397BC32D